MFMLNRAIAFVFLLIAPCLYGQDNSLKRSASDFDSKGVGLTETLLKFSHQQHLRIESVPSAHSYELLLQNIRKNL
jgi:hypothetical protein